LFRQIFDLRKVIHIVFIIFLLIHLVPEKIAGQDTIPPDLMTIRDTLPTAKKYTGRVKLDPMKATMLAATFPGAGQIYTRKYWKIPLVYAGFAGLGYAVAYNTKWYNTYTKAYQDFIDKVPETDSYAVLIRGTPPEQYDPVLHPDTYNPSTAAWIQDQLLAQVDYFRKYRDLSYIGIAAWYLISILDANVDASLSDYNINENLNIALSPITIPYHNFTGFGVGLTMTINF
jgi:hypothetical protein